MSTVSTERLCSVERGASRWPVSVRQDALQMERSSLSFLTWSFFTTVFLNTFLRLDVTVNHTLFLPAHPASPEAMRGRLAVLMSGNGCAGCGSAAPAPLRPAFHRLLATADLLPPRPLRYLYRILSSSDFVSESYYGIPAASLCLLINYLQGATVRIALHSTQTCASDPSAE